MSWTNVAVVFIFVAGAVTMGALGQKELALCLAGAAAGFIHSGGGERRVVRGKDPS